MTYDTTGTCAESGMNDGHQRQAFVIIQVINVGSILVAVSSQWSCLQRLFCHNTEVAM